MTSYLNPGIWTALSQAQGATTMTGCTMYGGIDYASQFGGARNQAPPAPMPSKPKTLHNCTFHELLDEFQALLIRF